MAEPALLPGEVMPPRTDVCIGDVYYNNKRGTLYVVTATPFQPDTGEDTVSYRSLGPDRKHYVRSLDSFAGATRVGNDLVPRFVRLDDAYIAALHKAASLRKPAAEELAGRLVARLRGALTLPGSVPAVMFVALLPEERDDLLDRCRRVFDEEVTF